ncbi:MAG: InlB B-repeat-containing protein, partial [Synergistaceae bacterium]|nr:InlB B-repeat-containing protein [Synergistaceae bacterium]
NFTPISYTITYDLDGGTLETPNPASYTIESSDFTLANPTKESYDFAGWTGTGLDSAALSVTIANGSTGNKEYTATWLETKPEFEQASYTFNAYKGTSANFVITATGINIAWSKTGDLPSGLSLTSSDNEVTISGTPEFGTSGSYSLTLTAANEGGDTSANVQIIVANDYSQSGDVKVEPATTITTSAGTSQTNTITTFVNGAGDTILSADVAITTESTDFEAVAGIEFSTVVSVDVSLDIADLDYTNYNFSMDIAGLPEWLTVSGEIASSDNAIKGAYHHEFVLSGTPMDSADVQAITFTALLSISGDVYDPELTISASKDIKISVGEPLLVSFNVELADASLRTDFGRAASLNLSAIVVVGYSNNKADVLPTDFYNLEWSTASEDLSNYGISFSNGTLSVNASALSGRYNVLVTVTATSIAGSFKASVSKIVSVIVNDVAPVLTASTENLTARRGDQITQITITATQGTNLAWTTSGELPEGLAYSQNGNNFVISGRISLAAATRVYNFTVNAANDAGSASKEISFTVQSAASTPTEEKTPEEMVVDTITNTLTSDDLENVTQEEIATAIENKQQEQADATKEASTGQVEDTTKPAGTDLIANSNTASDALKQANENLSVQPKVVTPEAATSEELDEYSDKLANVDEGSVKDEDIDLDLVNSAAENLQNDIEIENADSDLNAQAEKVEQIFNEVSKDLANVTNSAGNKGVVIVTIVPKLTPHKTGFFPMKVNLRNVTPGRKLRFWPSIEFFISYASGANIATLADDAKEGDAFFLDADGNPTTKVSGNAADMTVVPYLTEGKEYDSVFITTDATSNDLAALTTLTQSPDVSDNTTETTKTIGSSGAGCNSSFGFSAMLGLILCLISRKKR